MRTDTTLRGPGGEGWRRPRSGWHARAGVAALVGAAAMVGCDDGEGILQPGEGGPDDGTAFVQPVGLDVLQSEAAAGTVRLEVEIRPGGPPWPVEEVEIKTDDDLDDEEEIESRVVAVDPSAGTLTLALGNLLIETSASTRFETESSGPMARDAFLARLAARVATGARPPVEVSRPAPATPQAPSDPTFVALEVELDDEADDAEIEMNIDGRHLSVSGEGRGTLRLLGLTLELDRSQGTEFGDRDDDVRETWEVEGLLAAVGPASVTFLDGTVVRVVEATRVEADDDDDLGSLEEAAAALEAGLLVEAEAEVLPTEDGTLVAVELELEVEDDADDVPGAREFEGRLGAVDLGEATFTLASGAVFAVTPATRFEDDDDDGLPSLQAMADALAAGAVVEVEGASVTDPEVPGGRRALAVEAEVEDDDDDADDDGEEGREFEGMLGAVDVAGGSFTLVDGRRFLVTAVTSFDDDGDLYSLVGMADALAAGLPVEVEGEARLDVESGAWIALELEVEIDD